MTEQSPWDRLVDRRPAHLGALKWTGNEFVKLSETSTPGTFQLSVVPADRADATVPLAATLEGSTPSGDRVVAELSISAALGPVDYRVDGYQWATVGDHRPSLVAPWGIAGLVIRNATLTLAAESGASPLLSGSTATVRVGRWWVAISASEIEINGLTVSARGTSGVAVGTTSDGAQATALDLMRDANGHTERSRGEWNRYLSSCPIVLANEVAAIDGSLLDDGAAEVFVERQLWHWWAARMNIARSISRPDHVFVAPDRNRWHGTWSSDGPITLSALSLTSEREIAHEVFLRYLRTSIDENGHLSWYTHSDGSPSLGKLGDSGVFSHGVPDIVRAAEFISRGDRALLDVDGAYGRTVYGTLVHYLRASGSRDVDGDGLWETANLWESGWDNKVGPMFSSAPLAEWVAMISSGDLAGIAEFQRIHGRPVTSLAEQFSHLMALEAMVTMATERGDEVVATEAAEQVAQIRSVITERHWNAETGTYRDWSSSESTLAASDCLDGFYFLSYEESAERVQLLLNALNNSDRFGLPRPPTLARDDEQFLSGGYWDGSYWPREMLYVALGLRQQGKVRQALELLSSALFSGEGSEIHEHLDSVTFSELGFHEGATVYTQAMSVGLCLGLLEVVRGETWWADSHDAA